MLPDGRLDLALAIRRELERLGVRDRPDPRLRALHELPRGAVLLPPARRRRHRQAGRARMARLVTGLDAGLVRRRLAEAEERIAAACDRAGRSPGDVELPRGDQVRARADALGALAEAGIRLVGENIAADLEAKQERWGDRFTWDFIGHLQSRKTKVVLPRVRLIHSVESESVMRQIERHATGQARVLLEVNVAGEESKHGCPPGDVERFLESAAQFEAVRFAGLMTMPPLAERSRGRRGRTSRRCGSWPSALRPRGRRATSSRCSRWGRARTTRSRSRRERRSAGSGSVLYA